MFLSAGKQHNDHSWTLYDPDDYVQMDVSYDDRTQNITLQPLTHKAAGIVDTLATIARRGSSGISLPPLWEVLQRKGKKHRRNDRDEQGNHPRSNVDELRELRSDNAAQREELNTLRDDLDEANEKIGSRDRKIDRLSDENSSLRDKNDELRKERRSLRDEKKELAAKNMDYIQQIDAKEKALAALKAGSVDGDAAGAAPSPVKQERMAHPVEAPSGYCANLSWNFVNDAPTSTIHRNYEKCCEKAPADQVPAEHLIAPATVAFGWCENGFSIEDGMMQCACGCAITLGHEESLRHASWISRKFINGDVRGFVSKLEAAGHLQRPNPAYLSERLLKNYGYLIKIAVQHSQMHDKKCVEEAIGHLNAIQKADPKTIIDDATRMVHSARAMRPSDYVGENWEFQGSILRTYRELITAGLIWL